MPDKALIWQFLQFFQLSPEPRSGRLVHPRLWGEKADHDHLGCTLSNGAAEEAGVALMQHVHYPVVVNILSSLAHLISARRADGDLFGNRLVTIWTEFQGLFSREKWSQASGPCRAIVQGELNSQREVLLFGFDLGQTKKWRVFEGQISDDEQFVA